jgi:hypothetical protein
MSNDYIVANPKRGPCGPQDGEVELHLTDDTELILDEGMHGQAGQHGHGTKMAGLIFAQRSF